MNNTGRVAPFHKMQVWDATGPGQIQFDNHDSQTSTNNQKELGYIIENRVIQGSLYEKLKQLSKTVHILPKCNIEAINFAPCSDPLSNDYYSHSNPSFVGSDGSTPANKNKRQRVITNDDWVEVQTKQGQLLRTRLLVSHSIIQSISFLSLLCVLI